MTKFALNPEDEFEALVIQIVQTHREKAVPYGDEEDELRNFYDIAAAEQISPLAAAEHLGAKHKQVITRYAQNPEEKTKYTNDAFKDRAVYAILSWVLYERGDVEV